jgi:hypothetical protein
MTEKHKEHTAKADRPPVSEPPGSMAAPPGSLGKELEGKHSDTRPVVDTTAPPAAPPTPPVMELPEGSEDNTLELATERAKESGGNVYLVTGTLTTGQKGHITESDIPNADFARLVRLKVLQPIGELKADPKRAKALGKEGVEEIDRLQARNNELEADNERLEEENKKLRDENLKLRHKG